MIDLVDLSVQFGGRYLFDKVNLKINKGEKIALVGSNGTGKSTLMKLIMGTEKPETGSVLKPNRCKIGCLSQEFVNLRGKRLRDEVTYSLDYAIEIIESEKRIHKQLEIPGLSEKEKNNLLLELGELNHRKEQTDFYSLNARIEKVLAGLGFGDDDLNRFTEEFSGGWQMRIELAKILLSDNDMILLDEPTNHLDLDSLQWLINFLKGYRGTLLIVSHDRFFLNRVTEKTLEIFNRNLSFYNGRLDSYLQFKEERDQRIEAEIKLQQKKTKATREFIERFRYKATKAKQVQSRIKQLEKTEDIDAPVSEKEIRIQFPDPEKSGVLPVNIKGLVKTYGEKLVLDDINLQINREDKIALVGPNGAGKTTLSKIIAKKTQATKGAVEFGHKTSISYYAQEVAENLNPDLDLLESLAESADEMTALQLRKILGSFLFSDDDVFKKIKVLSGGEKSRVALAKILLTKANVIILDEPTNHLDFSSKRILQQALKDFKGTEIIVSHDVEFLKPVVNRVFEVRNNKVKIFEGGIDYYLRKSADLEQSDPGGKTDSKTESVQTKKDVKRIEAELRNKKYNLTKPLKTKIEKLEEKIHEMENSKAGLEKELADPAIYDNPEEIKLKNRLYTTTKEQLDTLMNEWSELSEELEETESSIDREMNELLNS